eukprot:CAMPEP_0184677900 /NCGR_PEP_ID=MMETSP0312-20130426/512_1 /TAXON_ID=31354 /ORGANISM="Compsopogon coeruleus, Strain SAG 36.94" /LENGTH=30 /DNA_ID= /DNA_START= /DNA_END= /DNA_ORIENTATION=
MAIESTASPEYDSMTALKDTDALSSSFFND